MRMRMKPGKSAIGLVIALLITVVICSCGVSEKDEKKLFNAMKENGLLDLTCDYEDYDSIRKVDQSPIPAVITYYEYNQNGISYTIDYDSRILRDNDTVYQVRVTTVEGEKSDTAVYYFEKDSFQFREKK